MAYSVFRTRKRVDTALYEWFGEEADPTVYDVIYESENDKLAFYPLLNVFAFEGHDKNVMLLVPKDQAPVSEPFAYIVFLEKALQHSDPEFVKMTHDIIKQHVPELAHISFRWNPLGRSIENVPRKKDTVEISYGVIHPDGIEEVRIDILELNNLCNGDLSVMYLAKSLRFYQTKKTFVVCGFGDDMEHRIQGIRVTYLSHPKNPFAFIKGTFACSKGVGAVIQKESEDAIRQHFAYLFQPIRHSTVDSTGVYGRTPRSVSNVNFDLYAIPSAVGFWKHMGFSETGKKRGTALQMSKSIVVEDRSSGNKKKQKQSE